MPARRARRTTRPRRRIMRRRQVAGRRRVASRIHKVVRLGQPMFIKNTSIVGGAPQVVADGGASLFQTTGATPSPFVTGNWELGLATQFQMSSALDYSDMVKLFDRYKITGVKLSIQYLCNVGNPNSQGGMLPTLFWAFDGDDSNPPATSAEIQAKGYCHSKVLNANRPISIFVRPRVTKEVFAGLVGPGYTSEKACWLDANSVDVPHYGVKMYLADWVGDSPANCLRITPTYYFALRDTQ